jgi:hypothetical protein
MKTIALLLCFALAATLAQAQSERFLYPDAFYFVKEVNIKGQKGKAFHFDISVKENPSDNLSKPRIYAIQARNGKDNFIGHTLTYAKPSDGLWKTYSIDGVADQNATRVWLYIAVNGNGDFYFDNLRFFLADDNGVLHEKKLPNASFEAPKPLADYYIGKPYASYASTLKVRLSPVASDGSQSVEVSTSGQKSAPYHPFASN